MMSSDAITLYTFGMRDGVVEKGMDESDLIGEWYWGLYAAVHGFEEFGLVRLRYLKKMMSSDSGINDILSINCICYRISIIKPPSRAHFTLSLSLSLLKKAGGRQP